MLFPVADRRVLVTGGRGFIGQAVVRLLRAAGAEVIAPSSSALDVRNASAVRSCVDANQVEAVVHLAGVVGGRRWLAARDEQIKRDGATMCASLLEASRCASLHRIVGVGSTAAFGSAAPRPLKESDLHQFPIPETIAGYADSKRQLGRMLEAMTEAQGIQLLPCNVYGEGQRTDADRANVIGAVASRMLHAVESGAQRVPCHGANAHREFLHVDDCAAAIVDGLQRLDCSEPVNIGSGCCESIRETTELIAEACGFGGELCWSDADQPIDALYSDASRARRLLPWRPRVDLKAGVERTVTWMRSEGRQA
ncbi:MAG: NAD-dependent epimerase/dehydratase family protein [Phycisphaerales bacterium]|nr:NAD-dependent epimerase/dehydratase family protein [Phycisphaerales bacterium]